MVLLCKLEFLGVNHTLVGIEKFPNICLQKCYLNLQFLAFVLFLYVLVQIIKIIFILFVHVFVKVQLRFLDQETAKGPFRCSNHSATSYRFTSLTTQRYKVLTKSKLLPVCYLSLWETANINF